MKLFYILNVLFIEQIAIAVERESQVNAVQTDQIQQLQQTQNIQQHTSNKNFQEISISNEIF